MKVLDKYVAYNFLKSTLMCMVAIILLRIVVSLFLEMDEFLEIKQEAQSSRIMLHHIASYYSFQSMQYFRELGGVIIVAAAAFSLWRMNHANELTTVLASGISLHRILLPIIICAIGFNLLIIADSELLIPSFKYQLIRSPDDLSGQEAYQIRLIVDEKNTAWYSRRFKPAEQSLENPLLILRDNRFAYIGHITAPMAVYDNSVKGWVFKSIASSTSSQTTPAVMQLKGCQEAPTTSFIPTAIGPDAIIKYVRSLPKNRAIDWKHARSIRSVKISDPSLNLTIHADRLILKKANGRIVGAILKNASFVYRRKKKTRQKEGDIIVSFQATAAIYKSDKHQRGWILSDGKLIYQSDLTPQELALRQSSNWIDYMSMAELTRLLRLKRVPDPQRAMLVRHSRFADFFNNIIMLLVAMPFILSRERNTKVSAGLALLMAGGTFAFIYLTRYIGLNPILAAWLPLLIFGPIAALMLDMIKT